jgi:hypothetical protein
MTSYVEMYQEVPSRKSGRTEPFHTYASRKRGETGQPDTFPGSTRVDVRLVGTKCSLDRYSTWHLSVRTFTVYLQPYPTTRVDSRAAGQRPYLL